MCVCVCVAVFAFPDKVPPCLVLVDELGSDRPAENKKRVTQSALKRGFLCEDKKEPRQPVPTNWDCWFFPEAQYKSQRGKKVGLRVYVISIFFFCGLTVLLSRHVQTYCLHNVVLDEQTSSLSGLL